jgi:hypothetical protein
MSPSEPKRTSIAKRLLVRVLAIAAIVIVLVIAFLEIGSRAADGIVERRKAVPGFDPKAYKPGLADKICFATLDAATNRLKEARVLPHPYLGYALRPDWNSSPADPQQCHHNSLGFRGKETTYEKPSGVFRIVTIGGSSVYGQSESSDKAVWSQRLEDMLNETHPARRIELINGGTFGYNSFENLVNLEFRLVDFHPDIVLLYEAINDMRVALWNAGGPVQNDNTQWRLPWPVDRPSSLERELEKSRTYLSWRYYFTNYAAERTDIAYWAMKGFAPKMPDAYMWNGPPPELGFATYRRNLNSMISVAELAGAKFVIATQALARFHLDMTGSRALQLAGFDRIQNIEREVAKERGAVVIESAKIVEAAIEKELADEIEKQRNLHPGETPDQIAWTAKRALHDFERMPPLPPPNGSIFKAEVHPYDRGSELIARTIANELTQSGVLPK